jgi:hypothetical protein
VDRLAEIAGSDVAGGAGAGTLDALPTIWRGCRVGGIGESGSGHKHSDYPNEFGHVLLHENNWWTLRLGTDWVQIGYRLDVNERGKSRLIHDKKPNKINVLMGEQHVRDAGVAGSNPATPTINMSFFIHLAKGQRRREDV